MYIYIRTYLLWSSFSRPSISSTLSLGSTSPLVKSTNSPRARRAPTFLAINSRNVVPVPAATRMCRLASTVMMRN